MMEQTSNCFLCGRGGDVKVFSIERYNKCLSILKVRKINKLKYNDMELLPYSGNDFYHSECYKNFSGVPKSLLSGEIEMRPKIYASRQVSY